MKKTILFILMVIVTMSYTNAQYKVDINGHVKFTNPDFKMTLFKPEGTSKKVFAESNIDANNNYSMQVNVDKPGVYYLDCGKWQMVPIWIEDENLNINFRGLDTAKIVIKNPPYVHINGGKKNELMNIMNFKDYRNYQMMIGISQAVYKQKELLGDSAYNALLISQYDMLNDDSKAFTKFLVEKYADRTSVLAAIERLNPTSDADVIEEAIEKVLAAHPNYEPIIEYRNKTIRDKEKKEKLAIGKEAPLFSYKAYNTNKKFGPKDFRGKILLIDFWASWCGPCRKEIPNLKEAYEEFKDQGVEFLSVSIDKNKADWEKAVVDEDMPWTQVLAPDAGAVVLDEYQFRGIPFIILLDQEGKFVAKNLRGENVKKEIQKLINASK